MALRSKLAVTTGAAGACLALFVVAAAPAAPRNGRIAFQRLDRVTTGLDEDARGPDWGTSTE